MLNLLFYGTVGDKDEGLDAVTIRTRIEESDGPIAARFNSGGGYVLEGMAIIKALQDAQAAGRKVTVYIDGLAASMASVIAMIGDEVIIAENAMIMIHNPFQVAIGDAAKLRQTADVLDKIRDQLLAIYAKRTGLSAKVLTAMMNAETWMNAAEALENRFVTSIADSSAAKAEVKPVDITAFGFNHVPKSPLILNQVPTTPGSPAPVLNVDPKEKKVDPALIAKILAYATANKVALDIQAKALAGEISYDEMVGQHVAAQAAAPSGADAVAAERTRVKRVRAYLEANPNVDKALAKKAEDGEITFDELVDQHVAAVANASPRGSNARVAVGETLDASPREEMQLRAEALTVRAFDAIKRMNPSANRKVPELSDRAKAFVNEGVRGAAAAIVTLNGGTIGSNMSDGDVVMEALRMGPQASSGGVTSTGDLGEALGQPSRAVLDDGYQSQVAETNFESWTSEQNVKDFKPNKSIHVGMLTGIRDVSEGGKLPLAKLGDGARYIQLSTRGLKVSFTREAIINDEWGALMAAVNKLGMVYRQDEQDIAVAALKAGVMTTDQGEEEIFDEQFHNYIEVPAFDRDALRIAKMELRAQKSDPKLGGFRLTSNPRTILVSPDLEEMAEILTTPGLINAAIASNANAGSNTRLNYQVIDDFDDGTAFLTGAVGLADVIKVSRLIRAPGPQIERVPQTSFNAVEFESYNDFTANGVGRLGIVKIKVTG